MIRPWPEIRSHYNQGPRFHSMLALVEKIEASRYVNGLYGWTSMWDLCVVQVPDILYPYNGPFLRIQPLFDGNIDFRYIDTRIEGKQWHRVVNEDEAFSRLEKFCEQLHWFTKQTTPST